MGLPRLGCLQSERFGQFTQCTRKEGYAVQKDEVLHFHAHDIYTAHDLFRLPFQHDGPIQNEMQVEGLGVICDSYDLIGPRAGPA